MAADDAIGDEAGDGGVLVTAVLDVVERLRADLESGLVLAVPIGHARVEVPAVVVEARAVSDLLTSASDMFSSTRNPTTTSATWTPVSSM